MGKFLIKRKGFNGRKISKECNLEYVPDITTDRIMIMNKSYLNKLYMKDNKYLLFYPLNDGNPICSFEWHANIDGKIIKVLDNQYSFVDNITNLSDVLCEVIKVYLNYIDDDRTLIGLYNFALKLEDPVVSNYKGRATLVLTDNIVKMERFQTKKELLEAKKNSINEFLDHFMGWNFGKLILENSDLESLLNRLNYIAILKEIRKQAKPGFEIFVSEEVRQYVLRKE